MACSNDATHPASYGLETSPPLQIFTVAELLDDVCRLTSRQADLKAAPLRVASTRLRVDGDRLLLTRLLSGLASKAIEHTPEGDVLLGCRRRGRDKLALEVWTVGVGAPKADLQHAPLHRGSEEGTSPATGQNGSAQPDANIVHDLAGSPGYEVRVRSRAGQATVYAIEGLRRARGSREEAAWTGDPRRAALVIEADDDLRSRIRDVAEDLGYAAWGASSVAVALDLVQALGRGPEVVIVGRPVCGTDPLAGLEQVRRKLGREVAGVVLASDIRLPRPDSSDVIDASRALTAARLFQAAARLGSAIQPRAAPLQAAPAAPPSRRPAAGSDAGQKAIAVVTARQDDRAQVSGLLRQAGRTVDEFTGLESFRRVDEPGRYGCVLADMDLPALELLESMGAQGKPPVVVMAEPVDVRPLIRAVNAGAAGFLELPIDPDALLDVVEHALARTPVKISDVPMASGQLATLTPRQRQILEMVLAGHPSKIIAADLGISQRTVENHRAAIMKRSGARSLPALTRMALQSC